VYLGVPLHADHPGHLSVLDGFHGLVVGPRRGDQRLAHPAERLMVIRRDAGPLAQHLDEPAALGDRDVVPGEAADHRAMPLMADDVGQVLDEVAAESDVEHLHAAADRKNRNVPFERGAHECELPVVAIRARWPGARIAGRGVARWIDVTAAGEHETVHAVEHDLGSAFRIGQRRRGKQHGHRPGRGQGVGVVGGQQIGDLTPDTPHRPLAVGGDSDSWPFQVLALHSEMVRLSSLQWAASLGRTRSPVGSNNGSRAATAPSTHSPNRSTAIRVPGPACSIGRYAYAIEAPIV
jgi:hypothetical protein